MTTAERHLMEGFIKLPVGGVMDLPAHLIRPTTGPDFKQSHSGSLIEVYPLVNIKSGEEAIWIDDGNRRYYTAIDQARREATRQGKPFHPSQVIVGVRRVVPENDIRVIFNSQDWVDI